MQNALLLKPPSQGGDPSHNEEIHPPAAQVQKQQTRH